MPLNTTHQYDGPERTLLAGADILAGQRVKLNGSGAAVKVGVGEHGVYVAMEDVDDGQIGAFRKISGGHTFQGIVTSAVAIGEIVYAANSGHLTPTPNAFSEGRALTAAAAAGDYITVDGLQENLAT